MTNIQAPPQSSPLISYYLLQNLDEVPHKQHQILCCHRIGPPSPTMLQPKLKPITQPANPQPIPDSWSLHSFNTLCVLDADATMQHTFYLFHTGSHIKHTFSRWQYRDLLPFTCGHAMCRRAFQINVILASAVKAELCKTRQAVRPAPIRCCHPPVPASRSFPQCSMGASIPQFLEGMAGKWHAYRHKPPKPSINPFLIVKG
mmetsp:Transcript_20539/g.44951  ORF Transcript_20539/g.44951 Transcript_20539/m.44951 type:complete len:202 (+) Transcript_20539:151-756(+)